MSVRVSAAAVACVLLLSLAARADAQLIPTVTPAFDPPARPTFSSRAPSLFAASQIVDRPTADLRPRFHWGISVSVAPNWSIPGSMGNWFFEDKVSPKMSGRDIRIGVVRARQLGFEMGASFVRKTISSVDITYGDLANSGLAGTTSYTAPNALEMMGADAHLIFPLARIGERVQLGILAGGGMAWLPSTPIQARIEGPPFFANESFPSTPLTSPPATGGFVRDRYSQPVPLVPGTRYAITDASLWDLSPSGNYWMLLRGQLAADFLVAPPLKIRVAGGFNYPGVQAIAIDGIYLFRTGRVGTTPAQPTPGAAPAPGAQIADQPQIIAPRRSYWGVLGGVTPQWWTPESWGPMFEPDDPEDLKGQEFRVGITRGRPLGYEFGVSFVMKTLSDFTFVRHGFQFANSASGAGIPSAFFDIVQTPVITLTRIEPVRAPGVDFHSFVPIGRIGSRVQLGGLLGAGIARVPDTAIRKRIQGPSYFASPTSLQPLATPPANGGFVVDEDGNAIPVPSGQTAAELLVSATEISPLDSILILARGQIAADVLLARPFKLRFSAGFNYPGAQLFGIEAVYMFGTGR